MILRATFENIYSIKDETQISFVAGKSNAHPSHVSRAEKRDDISVLKAGIGLWCQCFRKEQRHQGHCPAPADCQRKLSAKQGRTFQAC